MYHIDGDFGRVRLIQPFIPARMQGGLFGLESAGWHCCNDRYGISRPEGGANWLILLTVSGEGRLRFGGEERRLPPLSVAAIPPETGHAYFTPPGGLWEFYWLHPTGALSEALLRLLPPERRVWQLSDADGIFLGEQMERVLEKRQESMEQRALRLSRLTSAMLHRLMEGGLSDGGQMTLGQVACEYLQQHLSEPVTVRELAERAYLSPEHFIRRFRDEIGCTPHAFLMDCRLRQAELLLRFTKKTAAEIAAETGFSSPSHFAAQFRRAKGMTPTQFRQDERI